MSYPFKAFPVSKSKPRKLAAQIALMGGMALLSAGPLSADGRVYGHAEVTIGNPNVHITVGKTWGHTDHDCDRHEEKDDYVIEKRVILSDDDCHHDEYGKVVVYRNHPRCHREMRTVYMDGHDCHHNEYGKVVVYRNHPRCDREVRVFRHSEPVRYERDVRVIRENVPENCDRDSRVVEVVRPRPPVERVVVVRRPEHRVVVVDNGRGHGRHHDRKVIVTERNHSRHDGSDRKIIVHDGKGNGSGHSGDRVKIKEGRTDNGRHYGEKYEHSGHSSRRDQNDRPSKRVSRERGRSGRML